MRQTAMFAAAAALLFVTAGLATDGAPSLARESQVGAERLVVFEMFSRST